LNPVKLHVIDPVSESGGVAVVVPGYGDKTLGLIEKGRMAASNGVEAGQSGVIDLLSVFPSRGPVPSAPPDPTGSGGGGGKSSFPVNQMKGSAGIEP
jgi:hypothetical protein